MGKEGHTDRLEMVSREPTWAKKVPKDRLEMVSREPTWAKKVPKDRLEMVSRGPTWAKKVPRIDQRWLQENQLGQRRSQG